MKPPTTDTEDNMTGTDIRLLVDIEKSKWNIDSGVLRFTGRFCYIHPETGKLLNPRHDDWCDPHGVNHLDSLVVTAQINLDPGDTSGWYGFKCEYAEPFRVDLKFAELMVKTLKRVERRMDAMTEKLGYVDTLHGYVGRIGTILNVNVYGWRTKLGDMYENSEYRWGGVDSLRYHLDDNVKSNRVSA